MRKVGHLPTVLCRATLLLGCSEGFLYLCVDVVVLNQFGFSYSRQESGCAFPFARAYFQESSHIPFQQRFWRRHRFCCAPRSAIRVFSQAQHRGLWSGPACRSMRSRCWICEAIQTPRPWLRTLVRKSVLANPNQFDVGMAGPCMVKVYVCIFSFFLNRKTIVNEIP